MVFVREPPPAVSVFECLRLAWQEAQWEACFANEHWRGQGGPHGYLVYRAAQDRADAAQDALAHYSLRPR
jgi:hypothetical protein